MSTSPTPHRPRHPPILSRSSRTGGSPGAGSDRKPGRHGARQLGGVILVVGGLGIWGYCPGGHDAHGHRACRPKSVKLSVPGQLPDYQSPQTSPLSSPLDTRKKLSGAPPPQLEESAAEPGSWEDTGTGCQGEYWERWAGVVRGEGRT